MHGANNIVSTLGVNDAISPTYSLVYLPTGLGKTLVAAMVLQKMLRINPDRQAYFLVETNALALQQVCIVLCLC